MDCCPPIAAARNAGPRNSAQQHLDEPGSEKYSVDDDLIRFGKTHPYERWIKTLEVRIGEASHLLNAIRSGESRQVRTVYKVLAGATDLRG